MKQSLGIVMVSVLVWMAGCQQPQKEKSCPMASADKPSAKPCESEKKAAGPMAAKVEDIVIDNADPGFRGEGTWDAGESDKNYKDGVVWAQGGEQATAKAVWTPDIKVAGMYDVYEWHGEDPNEDHATNAPFTINSKCGAINVAVNLRENIGKWNLLGAFEFAVGKGGNVTLTNKANGNVIADAVKFVYKGK